MAAAMSVPYKLVNSIKYRLDFPDDWINTEMADGTGPRCCRGCAMFAFRDFSRVFSDYCLKCDNNVYHGTRKLPPMVDRGLIDKSFKNPNNSI